ncbi:MAG: FecR domain-containing protein [Desulfarculus sp.]|nr:FecR domain-containing protein [Desulfarculus sp.]
MFAKPLICLQVLLMGLLLAAGSSWAADAKQAGYIVRVKGKARVVNLPLKRDLAAVEKLVLLVGDKVETQAASVVEIALADDSLLQVGAESTLELSNVLFDPKEKKRSTTLGLPTGKVQALVNDLFDYGERKFEIKTQNTIAGVRGTIMIVLAPSPNETKVIGFDHPVEVANLNQPDVKVVVSNLTMTTVRGREAPTPPQPLTMQQFEQMQKGLQASGGQGQQENNKAGKGKGGAAQSEVQGPQTPLDSSETNPPELAGDTGVTGTGTQEGRALGLSKDQPNSSQGQGLALGLQKQSESGTTSQGKGLGLYMTKHTVLRTLSDGKVPGQGLAMGRGGAVHGGQGLAMGHGLGNSPGRGNAAVHSATGQPDGGSSSSLSSLPPGAAPQGGAPGSSPGGNNPPGLASASSGGQSSNSPGNSGNAPGQSGASPGNSGNAPGQNGTSPGNSGNAPGQSGSTPGNSGSAPGQSGSTPGNSGSTPGNSHSARHGYYE